MNTKTDYYKVPVTYLCSGYVEVEAENIVDLINKLNDADFVNSLPLPAEYDYVEESYKIDFDYLKEHYDNYKQKEELSGYISEYCSYCETEVELKWDVEKQGYKAYCPHCGSRLMLCDMCQHKAGDSITEDCDYKSETDTCRFNKKEETKIEKTILQLEDLQGHCKDLVDEYEINNIWSADIEALQIAIDLLKEKKEENIMRHDATQKIFEEIELFGIPMLFIDLRIDRKTVPEGVYLYEIRHSDENWEDPCEIAKGILVNFYGTVLSLTKLNLKEGHHYEIYTENDDWEYKDISMTLHDYIRNHIDHIGKKDFQIESYEDKCKSGIKA